MKIYVDKIILNPQQPRTVFDPDKLKELANSIKENGQEQDIMVEDNHDGTYTLVDGERRLRAHQILKMKTINASVREKTNHDGLERLVSATAANVARDNLNPVDEGNAYKKMRDLRMSVRMIARRCGTTTQIVYARLKLSEFTEIEQEALKTGKIPIVPEALDALLSIPGKKDRRDVVLTLAQRGSTTKVVLRVCAKFIAIKKEIRNTRIAKNKSKNKKKLPATPAIGLVEKEPPEWDALFQVNRVPPWVNFTESVMATCDHCALKPVASETTCASCPLVDMINRILRSVENGK